MPIWSAAVDPRVLTARAVDPQDALARPFDFQALCPRMVRGSAGEHVVFDRAGQVFRLDVIEGTTLAGPVVLCFEVREDRRLELQLAAIGELCGSRRPRRSHGRRVNGLLALQALDARESGASLKEIAEILLGPGDWPGDGEHRKSRVRRLLDLGDRMVGAGPRLVLEGP